MTSRLENVLNHFGKVKRVGKQYRTNCLGPNHANGDQNPSLDIWEAPSGKIVFNCRSGQCRTEDIVANTHGLEMKDLFPNSIATNGNGNAAYARLSSPAPIRYQPKMPNSYLEKKLTEIDDWDSHLVRGSEVKPQPVEWHIKGLSARGNLNGIVGDEQAGKSTGVCAIAAAESRGWGFPALDDPGEREPGKVLIWSPEESIDHVTVPRLIQMGADMERIEFIKDTFPLDEQDGQRRLAYYVSKTGPSMMFIDGIYSLTGRTDINNDSASRQFILNPLLSLSVKFNPATYFSRHTNKSRGMGQVRNAGMGSIAWRAVPRIEWLFGTDPENKQVRAFKQTKNNLGAPIEKCFGYSIDHDGFHWTGESKLTEAAMLAFKQVHTNEDRSALEEACTVLTDLLLGRPMPQKEVMKKTREYGLSDTTVNRAKYKLGIKPQKVRVDGVDFWEWSLK